MSPESNRANAQLSTGPRSEEGKARSSQNALKHGLTAQHLVVKPEEREAFEALQAHYQLEIAPQGALQQTLFDELVTAAWNLRRVGILEAESICSIPCPTVSRATTPVSSAPSTAP